jgi:hypothetical protein
MQYFTEFSRFRYQLLDTNSIHQSSLHLPQIESIKAVGTGSLARGGFSLPINLGGTMKSHRPGTSLERQEGNPETWVTAMYIQ